MLKSIAGFFTIAAGMIGLCLFEQMFIIASIFIVGINGLILLSRKSWKCGIIITGVALLAIFPFNPMFLRLVSAMAMLLGIGMVFRGFGYR